MVLVANVPQGGGGLYIYVNTHEGQNERPHVHVSRGSRKKRGDLKYYLDARDFDAKTTRGFTRVQLSKLRAYFAIYHAECLATWRKFHPLKSAR